MELKVKDFSDLKLMNPLLRKRRLKKEKSLKRSLKNERTEISARNRRPEIAQTAIKWGEIIP